MGLLQLVSGACCVCWWMHSVLWVVSVVFEASRWCLALWPAVTVRNGA